MNTKYSKSFTTWFFPVGDDIRAIVEGWIAYLRDQKLWGNDDPLFPATAVVNGKGLKFEVSGLARRHWSNAGPIRAIFRDAFTQARLTYFNPHSFRKALAQLGERVCCTPEVMTTLRSYGEVPSSRQAEIIRNLQRSIWTPQPHSRLWRRSFVGQRAGLLLRRIWAPGNRTDIERADAKAGRSAANSKH